MFEAVVALCLTAGEAPCRDALVPGYAAETLAQCETALNASPVDGARCAQAGPVLDVTEVAPGVFVHAGLVEEPDTDNKGDVSNLGFVVGADGVAVIDTGTTAWIAEAMWRAIRTETDKPVRHVIVTHMHPDHVLGVAFFARAGAQVVGHARLERALADRRENYLDSLSRLVGEGAFIGSDTAPVDLAVDSETVIDLGERALHLRAWPSAHTGTDVTVTDVETGVMFTGDLIFHRHTPALDGSLRGWQGVLAQMRAMDVRAIVPGHGAPILDWPEASKDMERYLDVLARDTRLAIEKGERLGEAVQHIANSERTLWELFEAYNPRNATVAFTELEWE